MLIQHRSVGERSWIAAIRLLVFVALVGPIKSPASDLLPARQSISNSIGMRLVLVPTGKFMMGNRHNAKDNSQTFTTADYPISQNSFNIEYPVHEEEVNQAFYMGTTCVTRVQFRRFVEATNYKTDAETGKYEYPEVRGAWDQTGTHAPPTLLKDRSWRNAGFPQTDEHPVVNISWRDAVAFCNWLSAKEHKKYRLPTEIEWEYACHAGTTTRYSFGDDPALLFKYGNVGDASLSKIQPAWKSSVARWDDGFAFTSPVGKFLPNQFGLYDMHGNVSQWCSDTFNTYQFNAFYSDSTSDVRDRVIRGGNWSSNPARATSTFRAGTAELDRFNWLGFRVVLEK